MSRPDHSPDLTRMLEALLSSPRAGQAVARTLAEQAEERQVRTAVADLRARRARHAYETELDTVEARRMDIAGGSPWSRAR